MSGGVILRPGDRPPTAIGKGIKGTSMTRDPTSIQSLDYLVELSDDGKQPDQPENEVLILPPLPPTPNGRTTPAGAPEQEKRS